MSTEWQKLSEDDLDKVTGGGGQPGGVVPPAGMPDFQSDMSGIMELMHKVALEQRGAAREARATARDDQMTSVLAEADRMKAAAQQQMAAGIVSGAASIAGAALSAGMAGSIRSAAFESKGSSQSTDTRDQLAQDTGKGKRPG